MVSLENYHDHPSLRLAATPGIVFAFAYFQTCNGNEHETTLKLEIKSDAYSEALQYRQHLFAITH